MWLLLVVTAVPAACGAEDSCIWLHLLNGNSKEIGLGSTKNPLGLMTSVVSSDPPHAHTTLPVFGAILGSAGCPHAPVGGVMQVLE